MPQDSLTPPSDYTSEMTEFFEELVDAVQLAEESYERISTEDMVAVLRYRVLVYSEYGVAALHPRNRRENDDIPRLDGLFEQTEEGEFESTDRRWFNVDVGFKTGIMYGGDISDSQMATVCRSLADQLES